MKNLIIAMSLLLLASGKTAVEPLKQNHSMETLPELTLTILYDNYNYDKNFRSSWGFSCLVEGLEKTILFDTGGKDGNLMHNLKAAGKNPADVDLIVLSHIHWDHTGGLDEFLSYKTGLDVFIPASFPKEFKKSIEDQGARPVEVKEAQKIIDHAWSTGEMGEQIIEQSLILETEGGLVVLTGWAHPGIEDIVYEAMEYRGKEVLLVMGGFHLLRTGTGKVRSIANDFKDRNVMYAAPTHCSGDSTRRIFEDVFGDHFILAGAGKVIHTAEL